MVQLLDGSISGGRVLKRIDSLLHCSLQLSLVSFKVWVILCYQAQKTSHIAIIGMFNIRGEISGKENRTLNITD